MWIFISKNKMKKRGAKRTKHLKHTKHSKKNFFDNKRLFLVGAAFFVIFAFLLMFVANNVSLSNSTQFTGEAISLKSGDSSLKSSPKVGTDSGQGFLGQLFASWTSGEDFDQNIAKFLFWIIVLLLLASAFNFAGFPQHGFLQFLLALIVSFLATAYITPNEVFSLLAGYTALGLTLVSVLPLLSIFMFSAMLVSNEKLKKVTIGRIMIQIVLWAFYTIFLLYKLITGFVTGGISLAINISTIALSVCLVISFMILIFNKKFRNWVWHVGDDIREMRERSISTGEAARERGRITTQEAREEGWGPTRSSYGR